MRSRAHIAAAVCAATVLGVAAAAPTATAARTALTTTPTRTADFNGDGYPDLAVSAITAKVDGLSKAGALAVVYGSATGLRYDTASTISQATPGVPGDPVVGGIWGIINGYGDLDGDGYDDLVILWGNQNHVLWGSSKGITGATTSVPKGDSTATAPWIYSGMSFGVGDVNGDQVDDMVVVGNIGSGAGVTVLLGPVNRTTGASAGVWHRDVKTLDKVGPDMLFVGDMTGDGVADIAVSTKVMTGSTLSGGVILKGSTSGLVKGSSYNGPDTIINGNRPTGVFGDLNSDGYADLAVGQKDLSKVFVSFGGSNGVSSTIPARTYTQSTSGVPGIDESYDWFGSAVAIGDTDRDGYPDLIIGAAGETGSDPATTDMSGAFTVLRGSATGITTTGAKVFTQNSSGIPSTSENNDRFGWSLAVTDTDRNGSPEVYVGGYGEDNWSGRVWKLATGATGVTGSGATSFRLSTLGVLSGGEFGWRLAG